MITNQFTYSSPGSFDEALALMQQDTNTQLMMGDQVLVSMLKHGEILPAAVVSLTNVPGTGDITADDKYLNIGPMVTYRELIAYLKNYPLQAISDALTCSADPHLLNHSTIGGALYYKGNSSGSVAAVLAVLGAEMEVLNTFGSTTITVYEWILSERFTGIEPGTILKSVRLPLQTDLKAAFQNHRYIKSGLNSFSVAVSIKNGAAQADSLKVVLAGRGLWPTAIDAVDKLITATGVDTEALTSAIMLAIGDQLASTNELLPETEYLMHLYTVVAKKAILKLTAI